MILKFNIKSNNYNFVIENNKIVIFIYEEISKTSGF